MIALVLSLMWPLNSIYGDRLTFQSKGGLAKGKLLIASHYLKDPYFSQTVILLLDYGAYGAMGLVLNRPTKEYLSTVFNEIEELKQRKEKLFWGGPVGEDLILMLIRTSSKTKNNYHVFANTYVSSNLALLQAIAGNPRANDSFRIYTGFVGWAPGQLDSEVSTGSWQILCGDSTIVFDKTASEIWPDLIRYNSVQMVHAYEPIRNLKLTPGYRHIAQTVGTDSLQSMR